MRLHLTPLLALVALVCLTHETGGSNPCDDFADSIIEKVKENKEYFDDPLIFKNKTMRMEKTLLFTKIKMDVGMTDGIITGLSSLKRSESVFVERKGGRDRMLLRMSASDLKMDCKAEMEMLTKHRDIDLHGEIAFLKMRVVMSVDAGTGHNPEVEEVIIEESKGTKVKVRGGLTKILTKLLVHFSKIFFKKNIRENTENAFKEFLDKKYKEFDVPDACIFGRD